MGQIDMEVLRIYGEKMGKEAIKDSSKPHKAIPQQILSDKRLSKGRDYFLRCKENMLFK